MIARLATERLFIGVGAQVLQEMSLERSLADGALERFHSAVVAAEMLAEAVAPRERFGAHRARIVALSSMTSHMHLFNNKYSLSTTPSSSVYAFVMIFFH